MYIIIHVTLYLKINWFLTFSILFTVKAGQILFTVKDRQSIAMYHDIYNSLQNYILKTFQQIYFIYDKTWKVKC